MRTTLELDDELVATAKQLARQRDVSLGRIISDLASQSLAAKAPPRVRNGVMVFESKPGSVKVDMELVNRLRDEE
jgi:hypothetical protein